MDKEYIRQAIRAEIQEYIDDFERDIISRDIMDNIQGMAFSLARRLDIDLLETASKGTVSCEILRDNCQLTHHFNMKHESEEREE